MHDRHQSAGTDSTNGPTPNPREYVRQNQELLARVLARGDREAQSYVLALIAEAGTTHDIDEIQGLLDDLRDVDRE